MVTVDLDLFLQEITKGNVIGTGTSTTTIGGQQQILPVIVTGTYNNLQVDLSFAGDSIQAGTTFTYSGKMQPDNKTIVGQLNVTLQGTAIPSINMTLTKK